MEEITALRPREFNVGDVLSRSFTIWFRNLIPFSLLALFVNVPLLVWHGVADRLMEAAIEDVGLLLVLMLALVPAFLGLILGMLVQATLIYGVFQQLRDRPAPLMECLAVGFRRLGAAIGVAFVAGIIIAVGFLLLIVPGIYWTCVYWVAVPVAVVERPGIGAALRRSRILTDGFKWKVLGLWAIIVAIQIGAGSVLGIGIAVGVESDVVIQIFSWLQMIVGIILGALQAVVVAVAYHDLRAAKEGIGVEDLAAVFE